jgi:hypothetical protein
MSQRIVKDGKHPDLGMRLKVNKKISARNQIDLGERRIPQNIMRNKGNHAADLRANAKRAPLLDKVRPHPLFTYSLKTLGCINSGHGNRQ